jgi:hypothetical protein
MQYCLFIHLGRSVFFVLLFPLFVPAGDASCGDIPRTRERISEGRCLCWKTENCWLLPTVKACVSGKWRRLARRNIAFRRAGLTLRGVRRFPLCQLPNLLVLRCRCLCRFCLSGVMGGFQRRRRIWTCVRYTCLPFTFVPLLPLEQMIVAIYQIVDALLLPVTCCDDVDGII